jgi:putative effector of murein hydrolase LrgA (UPF0299 family)
MAKKQTIGYQPIDTAYTKDIDAWFIIVMIIFFFPMGLWLMWTRTSWTKSAKVLCTVIVAVLFVSNAIGIVRDYTQSSGDETTEQTESVSRADIANDDFSVCAYTYAINGTE